MVVLSATPICYYRTFGHLRLPTVGCYGYLLLQFGPSGPVQYTTLTVPYPTLLLLDPIQWTGAYANYDQWSRAGLDNVFGGG